MELLEPVSYIHFTQRALELWKSFTTAGLGCGENERGDSRSNSPIIPPPRSGGGGGGCGSIQKAVVLVEAQDSFLHVVNVI